MAKFIVRETREMIITATLEAADAERALRYYKSRRDPGIFDLEISICSDETHITVDEVKEDKVWPQTTN